MDQNAIRLRQTIKDKFDDKQSYVDVRPGNLGNENYIVEVPGMPNYVYVREVNGGAAVPVYNARVSATWNLPVSIGFTNEMPDILQVIEQRSVQVNSTTGAGFENTNGTITLHSSTHTIPYGPDPVWLWKNQLLDGRVTALPEASGSLLARVERNHFLSSGSIINTDDAQVDLQPYVPTSGSARWVTLSTDASGSVVFTSSAAFPSTDWGIEFIPAVPSGNAPNAAVRVYYGQTGIYQGISGTDIQDLRGMEGDAWSSSAPADARYVVSGSSAQLPNAVILSGSSPIYTNGSGLVGLHYDNTLSVSSGSLHAATAPGNLTGPITSVGLATAIASQTGSGSTFVMDDAPTIRNTTTLSGSAVPDGQSTVVLSIKDSTGGVTNEIRSEETGTSVLIGVGAGSSLGTGTGGANSVAVGNLTLLNTTTGYNNVAVGDISMTDNVDGSNNTAVGASALAGNISGQYNVSIGESSMSSNTVGTDNTAVGDIALTSNVDGGGNVAVGEHALGSNISGDTNVAVGINAGAASSGGDNTTGENGVFIGASTSALADGGINEIVIGANAVGLGSNSTMIGNILTELAEIKGTSVGIGGPPASGSGTLQVTGTVRITGGAPGTGKVLTSDADGIASWETPSGSSGSAVTKAVLSGSSPLSVTGSGSILDSALTVEITKADTSTDGYLSSADWNTFNSKQNILTLSSLTPEDVQTLAGSAGTSGSISRSDHSHFHGNLSGGSLHSVSTVLKEGFLDKLSGSAADFINGTGMWSIPDHSLLGNLTTGDPHTQYVKKAGDTMTGDLTMDTASVKGMDTAEFNLLYSTTGSEAVGSLFWNPVDGTINIKLLNDATLQTGQELHFYGKCSGTIDNGDVVQFAGVQGDHILIKKAVGAQLMLHPHYLVGVATQAIANGNFGYVTWFGKVNGVYTTGWTVGDLLYVDNATGQLTNVEPTVPERKIIVAALIKKATGASENGIIIVRPTFGLRTTDLDDVDTTGLVNGTHLQWSTSGSKFTPTTNISGSAGYSGSSGSSTISGSATYATYSGSSDYATLSGSAGFSTRSGSAEGGYAVTAGSSGFSTRSGSAEGGYALTAGSSTYATTAAYLTRDVIMQDPTGFKTPTEVIVTYDPIGRTITLSGSSGSLIGALWQGQEVTALSGSAWTSGSHLTTNGTHFLSYNGTSFVWSMTPWTFDQLQIAYAYYGASDKFGLRESHGLMQWQSHEAFHDTIGTYRESGGALTGWVPASTTAANRRPAVGATVIHDEDLITTVPALSSGSYTQMYLSGSAATNTFVKGRTDFVPLLTNNPYYNKWDGAGWIQTLMSNNSYMSVWLIAMPATASAASQEYRYLWMQGQTNGTLATQQALTPNDLNLGRLAAMSPEYVFLAKAILRYTGGNWEITSITNLTGNKFIQSTATAIVPEHNALVGLQGGSVLAGLPDEFYHLTASESALITSGSWGSGSVIPSNQGGTGKINNAAYTLYFSASGSIGGVNTGDQTITLTGAITGSGLGSFATSLGSFTSSALATALTDETGSGSSVFAISPVLTTPNIGAATATSINGNFLTAGSGTINLMGNTLSVPASGSGVVGSGAANQLAYFSGANTLTSGSNFTIVGGSALQTAAESWIGPSATGGIYFKGGLIGIGKMPSDSALDVNGVITTDGFVTADDKYIYGVTFGRYSAGYPSSYLSPSTTSEGISFTNPERDMNVLTTRGHTVGNGRVIINSGTIIVDDGVNALQVIGTAYVDSNIGVGTTAFGSGIRVIGIANAAIAPSGSPTGGGVLYSSAGQLKWLNSSGEAIALSATNKATLSMRPTLISSKIKKVGEDYSAIPTQVDYGSTSGFSLPIYSAGSDEELYFSEYIAGRWDGASDITLSVIGYLSAAEDANDDFNLQLSWNNKATASGVISGTPTDQTVETNIPDARKAQYSIYKVEFTIDWDAGTPDIVASDYFSGRLRRVAVAGGSTEMAGEFVVTAIVITYTVNKIYKST